MLNWRWSLVTLLGLFAALLLVGMLVHDGTGELAVQERTLSSRLLDRLGVPGSTDKDDPEKIIYFSLTSKSNPKDKVRLGIPRKYLHVTDVGSYRMTTIEVVLPDLRPGKTPYGQSSKLNPSEDELAEWRNQVTIEWIGGKANPDDAGRWYEGLIHDLQQLRDPGIGLQHFRRRVCFGDTSSNATDAATRPTDAEQCHWQGSHFYTYPPVLGEPWLSFKCSDSTGRVKCRALTHVRGWAIEYVIERSELGRWREFDKAVRQLVEGFFVLGRIAPDAK